MSNETTQTAPAVFRAHQGDCRWDATPVLEYKTQGSHFQGVTRQYLFSGPDMGFEWRYFEVEAGGYSSLERHEHVHAVMIVRGRSICTSVLNGGSSSREFQPSSKTWRVTGSKRPEGLMPAERPRRRSPSIRMPLLSMSALAISERPRSNAAASARLIVSIWLFSVAALPRADMNLFLFRE